MQIEKSGPGRVGGWALGGALALAGALTLAACEHDDHDDHDGHEHGDGGHHHGDSGNGHGGHGGHGGEGAHGGHGGEGGHGGHAGEGGHGGHGGGAPDERAMTFVPGMEVAGLAEILKVTLTAAEPAPPDRGDNRWTITVSTVDGDAQSGCTIGAEPLMPDHGHGTTIIPQIEAINPPGTYVVDPLNLFMPGLWTIDLTADCPAGVDRVTFAFWIES